LGTTARACRPVRGAVEDTLALRTITAALAPQEWNANLDPKAATDALQRLAGAGRMPLAEEQPATVTPAVSAPVKFFALNEGLKAQGARIVKGKCGCLRADNLAANEC